MRVVMNYAPAMGRRTGIGHYTALLATHLEALVTIEKVVPQKHPLVNAGKAMLEAIGIGTATSHFPGLLRHWLRGAARYLCGQGFHKRTPPSRYDLYHEPNYLPWPTELPTVATWHDLSVFDHPEWHPRDRVRYFERQLPKALEQTSHFIADSEFTRLGMMARFNLPAERVTTVHLGIRPDLAPLPADQVKEQLRQLKLPTNYLLHVGTIEPRKNLLLLMRAYCALPSALREQCPLLLVGGWGWEVKAIRRFYEADARHRGVMHVGYLADEHLCALYNGARALVFPTLYEGFGFPPLEMMACGGAVLASTAAAIEEMLGPHAYRIDPRDETGWRDALARACGDDGWLEELRRGAVKHARIFTWERCARETVEVYRRVLGAPAARAA